MIHQPGQLGLAAPEIVSACVFYLVSHCFLNVERGRFGSVRQFKRKRDTYYKCQGYSVLLPLE